MKLIDLLLKADENKNYYVFDENGRELARYDGKNSIEEVYNNCEVVAYTATSAIVRL